MEIKRGGILKNVLTERINKKRPLDRPTTRWKDTVKKDMRPVDGNATIDWASDRGKRRSSLVAAQVLNGPLSC